MINIEQMQWMKTIESDHIWKTYKATEFQIETVTNDSELLANVLFQYTSPKVWNRLGSEFRHKPWRRALDIIGMDHAHISFKHQQMYHVYNAL